MSERYRPNLRHSLENWSSYEGSFVTKLKLTFKNEWRKVRRFKDCCGNINEPGC